MSQALFEREAGGAHEARSAGTTPGERVHPEVVEAMRELGIDVSGRVPQKLTDDLAQWADVVVTMGCGDECPYIPGKRYIDWDLPRPEGPAGRGGARDPRRHRARVRDARARAQRLTADRRRAACAAVRRPSSGARTSGTCGRVAARRLAARAHRLLGDDAVLQLRLVQTVFVSRYSSSPARPCSRPTPEALKPPNGAAGSVRPQTFTYTVPARSSAARRCAVPTSRVHTPAASPYSVSFARSATSSTES